MVTINLKSFIPYTGVQWFSEIKSYLFQIFLQHKFSQQVIKNIINIVFLSDIYWCTLTDAFNKEQEK